MDSGSSEVDIFEHSQSGREVPHARTYRVRIDSETFRIDTQHPTGEQLLTLVRKRPCAFDLIAEFVHHESDIVEPKEQVDLRQKGLKDFITAHKQIVTIFINNDPYQIEEGERTVAEILGKVGQTPEGYDLFEEKDGPPMPVSPDQPVRIEGCEVFHTQTRSGGSS